jgi:hypothetical protein
MKPQKAWAIVTRKNKIAETGPLLTFTSERKAKKVTLKKFGETVKPVTITVDKEK